MRDGGRGSGGLNLHQRGGVWMGYDKCVINGLGRYISTILNFFALEVEAFEIQAYQTLNLNFFHFTLDSSCLRLYLVSILRKFSTA